jgi:hypothetical protein
MWTDTVVGMTCLIRTVVSIGDENLVAKEILTRMLCLQVDTDTDQSLEIIYFSYFFLIFLLLILTLDITFLTHLTQF